MLKKYDLLHGIEEDLSYLQTTQTRANTRSSHKSYYFYRQKKHSPSQEELLLKKNKFDKQMDKWKVGTVLTKEKLMKHLCEM